MNRYDAIIKNLNKALQEAHLYSEEEIRFMKTQLRSLQEDRKQLLNEGKNGFGS